MPCRTICAICDLPMETPLHGPFSGLIQNACGMINKYVSFLCSCFPSTDLLIEPGEINGPIGGDYSFVCRLDLSSGGPPDLVWMKDGTELVSNDQYVVMHTPNNAESSTESKLTILNAQKDDEGAYVCQYGDSMFSVDLMVYQQYGNEVES